MKLQDLEFKEIEEKFFSPYYEAKIKIREELYLVITTYSLPYIDGTVFVENDNNGRTKAIECNAGEYEVNSYLSLFIN